MLRWILLFGSHAVVFVVGFALGIYLLPILTAPPSVDRTMLADTARTARYQATFDRDLKGSDFLHWREGTVSITPDQVVHEGALSPGPNYMLYLVEEFVEDEAGFLPIKDQARRVGDIKTFDGFLIDLPPGTDIEAYTTVLIWCEAFSEFITAARYR